MNLEPGHSWCLSPQEAVSLQRKLSERVALIDEPNTPQTVAGVDVGFSRAKNMGRAAVVVLDLVTLEPLEQVVAEVELRFPYVPGLLSFREMPAILEALAKLKRAPDIFLCDGQGIAHPRRFGIACHLGVVTGTPAVGVAKTRLVGEYLEPGEKKGAWSSLVDKNEQIGAVLRTREKVSPVFISPGHRITLESSIKRVLQTVTRYRLPETTRRAHTLSLFR